MNSQFFGYLLDVDSA